MSYYYFRKLVKKLAENVELRKDVWPYLFRHSCLTALAKVLTESRLELYAGWIPGSRMARRYVHFSARDLEETVLEIHGLGESKRSDGNQSAVSDSILFCSHLHLKSKKERIQLNLSLVKSC